VHSGLAYGAADGVGEAFAAMAGGARSAGALGARAFAAMGPHARVVPALVVHGDADRTVAPANARQVLEQAMAANRMAGGEAAALDSARPADVERLSGAGARDAVRSRWRDRDGRLLHELLLVEGLGHAWSGGAAGHAHTDPRGPSATEAICSFFAAVARAKPET
jgi:poly(3-hydroxybutyrate) depolymerase